MKFYLSHFIDENFTLSVRLYPAAVIFDFRLYHAVAGSAAYRHFGNLKIFSGNGLVVFSDSYLRFRAGFIYFKNQRTFRPIAAKILSLVCNLIPARLIGNEFSALIWHVLPVYAKRNPYLCLAGNSIVRTGGGNGVRTPLHAVRHGRLVFVLYIDNQGRGQFIVYFRAGKALPRHLGNDNRRAFAYHRTVIYTSPVVKPSQTYSAPPHQTGLSKSINAYLPSPSEVKSSTTWRLG